MTKDTFFAMALGPEAPPVIVSEVELRGVKFDVTWGYEGDSHDEIEIQVESVSLQGSDADLLNYLDTEIIEEIVGKLYHEAEEDLTERKVSAAEEKAEILEEVKRMAGGGA